MEIGSMLGWLVQLAQLMMVCAADNKQHYYQLVRNASLPAPFLAELWAVSLMDCARLCLDHPACPAANYQHQAANCQLLESSAPTHTDSHASTLILLRLIASRPLHSLICCFRVVLMLYIISQYNMILKRFISNISNGSENTTQILQLNVFDKHLTNNDRM